jgi:formate dehydrogenase
VVVSQPFWPVYIDQGTLQKAKKLKLIITAGIGSDHTDLQAAMDKGVTVAEVTYCNSISVSEHIVMMILALVRNYIPSYGWVIKGGWNIGDCVERSYDLEGMNVGTVAGGRIGLAALRRLKPFDVKLHYTDKHRLPKKVEKDLRVPGQGLRRGDNQRAAAPRDRRHVQRQADRQDEARQLYREHRARKDLRP